MSKRGTNSKLPPLPPDLAAEIRELVDFLRERFGQLRITPREYGRIRNWDVDVILSYLSGQQIPPQDFIDFLLEDADRSRSTDTVNREHDKSLRLRARALEIAEIRRSEQERLERELSEVRKQINIAEAKERDLTSKLKKKKADYRELLKSYKELESITRIDATNTPRAIESNRVKFEVVSRQRGDVQQEIERLSRELDIEKAARVAAEEKQDELRAELDRARAQVHLSGDSTPIFGQYRPRTLVIFRGTTVRPLLTVGIIGVCACTLYLGLVYHLLSEHQITLKVITISWLILPIFVLALIGQVGRGEMSNFARYLACSVIVAIGLFFLGALI